MALGIIVVGGKFASGNNRAGPVAGVERDVVMIAPGSPTRKAGRNLPFGCSPRTSPT